MFIINIIIIIIIDIIIITGISIIQVLGKRLKYSSAYWPEGVETLDKGTNIS